MLLYGLPAQVISPTAGIISLAGSGVLGLLLRNKMADKITRLYINQKHETMKHLINNPMIKVNNLTKIYADNALSFNTFHLKGEHFGLVGNNGAGKTTFFSLLLDLIQATSGQVTINGIEVAKAKYGKQTAAFIDDNFLIDYLTPEEYFQFVAQLRR